MLTSEPNPNRKHKRPGSKTPSVKVKSCAPMEIFKSFLPLRNPIGFGASDFSFLAITLLLAAFLFASNHAKPYLRQLSQRPYQCALTLFFLPIILRLALLPVSGIPIPSGSDDFGYLLLSDTLAHFRLANPAHPLYPFFEAVFILQQPKYASIYPLGPAFFLALGQLIFRNPWFGVLLSSGLFSAACYWMLRAWVTPLWSLLGGLLAAIEFGPLCSWTNSYWGGFASALAGCLVFGALPRLKQQSPRLRNSVLLGLGLSLQLLTRPFEAIFLTLAAIIFLRRINGPALTLLTAALALTLAQNKAVTQSWTTMPYMESRYQYGVPATFTFQPNAIPHRPMTAAEVHAFMTAEQDLDYRAQAAIHGPATDTLPEFFNRLAYRFRYLRFFLLTPLYFALFAFIPSLREKRYAWLAATILFFALGTNIYPYFYPQYIAALTCLFVLLSVKGIQRLRPTSRQYLLAACAAGFAFWFAIFASSNQNLNRGDPQGRAAIAGKLAHEPGQQLVFVRYSAAHRFEEWIHNDADIDSAHTVWANDLGNTENDKLIRYYPKRKVWLLEPDVKPVTLKEYVSEPAGSPFETVR